MLIAGGLSVCELVGDTGLVSPKTAVFGVFCASAAKLLALAQANMANCHEIGI
jgi:hypothetical protein